MRGWVGAAVVVVALVPAPAVADCAAPSITVDAVTVAPGDDIHFTGDWFADGCNDNGSQCGIIPRGPTPPMTDVQLELRRGMADVDAVVVHADDEYGFEADLTVPKDAKPGSYFVVSVHEQTELDRLEITVERTP
jgi:hypothetical protein